MPKGYLGRAGGSFSFLALHLLVTAKHYFTKKKKYILNSPLSRALLSAWSSQTLPFVQHMPYHCACTTLQCLGRHLVLRLPNPFTCSS